MTIMNQEQLIKPLHNLMVETSIRVSNQQMLVTLC
jgi:hypothetical protein